MIDFEWFQGKSSDESMERCFWRRVAAVITAALIVFLLVFPAELMAEPLYLTTTPDGTVITIYSEKCALPEVVNLPRRATWVEKGKTFEGCWGASPFGVVMFYFSDKTVAMVPAEAFSKAQGV